MKCFTCVNFERAKKKGKIKTSKACEGCWSPDWSKLSPELKKFYIWLSKLNDTEFNLFKRFWRGESLPHYTAKSNKKIKEDDFTAIVANMKGVSSELKNIAKIDIAETEYPYINFFVDQLEIINRIKSVEVFVGDKFEYMIGGGKVKLEVEHLTPETIVASNKKMRVSLLYNSLLDTKQVVGKVFERSR